MKLRKQDEEFLNGLKARLYGRRSLRKVARDPRISFAAVYTASNLNWDQ